VAIRAETHNPRKPKVAAGACLADHNLALVVKANQIAVAASHSPDKAEVVRIVGAASRIAAYLAGQAAERASCITALAVVGRAASALDSSMVVAWQVSRAVNIRVI